LFLALSKPHSGSADRDGRAAAGLVARDELVGRLEIPTPVLVILIAVLWLATRPYQGLWGDARFYMVQALHDLQPSRYADDLYFRFGSQDQFTIFSKLYAPAVSLLGVDRAALVFTALAAILWLCGLVYLALGLARDRSLALLSVAAVIVLPDVYTTFGYGEGFATPRPFAEGLVLFGAGLIIRRHTILAFLVVTAAASLHPLMALPGFAFLFVYCALAQPLWWFVAGLGAVLVTALAWLGIPPFTQLRIAYDPAWLAIAKIRDAQCFIAQWGVAALSQIVSAVALLGLAAANAGSGNRRVLVSVAIVGIGGVVTTFIGADLFHNVFVTELQPWRSMWLLTLIANLYLLPTLVKFLGRNEIENLTRLLFFSALAAFFFSKFVGSVIVAGPALALAVAILLWQRWARRKLPTILRLFCCVAIAVIFGLTSLYLIFGFKALYETWPDDFRSSLYTLLFEIAVFAILGARLTAKSAFCDRVSKYAGWVSIPLLAAALLVWDQRTSWEKFIESDEPIPPTLAAALPENASVYWEAGLGFLWFHWKRSEYFSCGQGTGVVFFRDAAMTYQDRAESFWPLRTFDFGEEDLCPGLGDQTREARTRAGMENLCRREPALDYAVLTRPIDGIEPRVWTSPVPLQALSAANGAAYILRTDRFYIYSCASFRAG
jgi:hypothetical protein